MLWCRFRFFGGGRARRGVSKGVSFLSVVIPLPHIAAGVTAILMALLLVFGVTGMI